LDLPGAELYVEVHHIKPVAQGGTLADATFSNCLVLCPSCHVLFQSGALWIDSSDGRTIHHFQGDARYERKKLRFLKDHQISQSVLEEAERAAAE
jgi:predicted restriction endonuclease